MRIPRIFVDQALQPHTEICFTQETSHYLSRVLRLSLDAKIRVFDGKSGEYEAKITNIQKNRVTASLSAFIEESRQSPLPVHLAIGISRGERMDWVIQKSTELGVASIVPLFSERCEVKLDSKRLQSKLTHWRKVAISACEQSGLNIIPEIHPPQQLKEWLPTANTDLKLVLHPLDSQPLARLATPDSVTLLIGPEGGFSQSEITAAIQSSFQPIQLGPRILRTESAPIVAISILQYQWGDLGHNLQH